MTVAKIEQVTDSTMINNSFTLAYSHARWYKLKYKQIHDARLIAILKSKLEFYWRIL